MTIAPTSAPMFEPSHTSAAETLALIFGAICIIAVIMTLLYNLTHAGAHEVLGQIDADIRPVPRFAMPPPAPPIMRDLPMVWPPIDHI